MNSTKNEIAEQILRLRFNQMIINEKYKNKEFVIPIHLALGHEAIAVCVDIIMEDCDQLVLSHRNIHYNLAREKNLKCEIDEFLLKKEGLAKGQLGSMNLTNEKKGIMYASSILGNNLSVAAGLAFGKKVKKESGVVIVVTGDGAIEEGSFYESLLFAKSNNLPLIMIVENNDWSLATRIEERRCIINLKNFVGSLGISYELLKGNDIYSYIKKLESLRGYALSNNTPVCIEVNLTTLGSWCQIVEGYPNGKFINYHAGPAPKINIEGGPIIENSENDPIFVLKTFFGDEQFKKMSNKVLNDIKDEIK